MPSSHNNVRLVYSFTCMSFSCVLVVFFILVLITRPAFVYFGWKLCGLEGSYVLVYLAPSDLHLFGHNLLMLVYRDHGRLHH